MAAGLSLKGKDFHVFQDLFDQEVRKHLSDEKLHQIIYSDGALVGDDFNLELAEQLRIISPWGQGFPEPIFDGEFRLIERRVLKEKHLKMQLLPLDGNIFLEAIAFNYLDTAWPVGASQISLAYKLDVNNYRGFSKVQLLVEHVDSVC
jgi:single-stranded-DNA-specific exonuclease